MEYQHDFNAPWQNLPKVKRYKGVDIHFIDNKVSGLIYDDAEYIIQVMRNDRSCTILFEIIHEFLSPDSCRYIIFHPLFKDLEHKFPRSLPSQIKERYPLLSKMVQNEDICRYFSFSSSKDYGSFITCRMSTKKIKEGELSDNQAKFIVKAADTVLKAEEEYENFRYSVLYRNIQKAYRKQKSKQENAQVAVGVYKALRFGLLCFNLMNGNSDSGSDLGSSMDFSGVDLGNLDLPDNMSLANLDENPAFIDYLTSPADQVSFGNSYDNNAVDFLKTCKEHGVDLPNNVNTSTNSYTTVVDRDYNGGLTGIDKTLIGHKLDNMLKAGDLSQRDFDELKSKLSKT